MSGFLGSFIGVVANAASGAADAFFNYVTLLLNGDGTNGAQNNTFLDSSANTFTITRTGTPTQGTFSPFSQTGWSGYFNGTTDVIRCPDSSAFTLTGDFTFETWVFPTAITAGNNNMLTQWGSTNAWIFRYVAAGRVRLTTSGGDITGTTTAVTLNTWNHVAVVRSGTTVKIFVNGIQDATTGTISGSLPNSPDLVAIGGYSGSAIELVTGYMSNLRLVNGTAVYTANFTPPTAPLTAISGTALLVLQTNRFVDNSATPKTLTVTGTPSIQAFSPFNPTIPYSAAVVGGSGYFNIVDFVYNASSATVSMGTGDFTLEAFAYFTGAGGTATGVFHLSPSIGGGGTTSNSLAVGLVTGSSAYQVYAANTNTNTSGVTPVLNAWNHIALVRASGVTKLYVNALQALSLTDTTNYSGTYFNVGAIFATGSNGMIGYISSARATKGGALYTGSSTTVPNFTIPSGPLTTTVSSGTVSVLLNFTNAGITDATAKNDLTTVGSAQVSTAVTKFGTGSMKFAGTSDWLTAPFSQNANLGLGSFTIEMWVNPTSITGIVGLYAISGGSGATPKMVVHLDAGTPKIHFNNLTGGANIYTSATSAVSAGVWTYIAFVRNGSVWTWYVNGSTAGTGSNSTDITFTTQPTYVGYGGESYFAPLTGYIDDLRITKGVARTITVPTQAFPVQ